jgi:hypothetical protein
MTTMLLLFFGIYTGRGFLRGTPVSLTKKTDNNDIAEILLEVTLNTINQTPTIHGGRINLKIFMNMGVV